MNVSKPNVDLDGLYNQKQAAAALGVERHTLARYAAQGLIRFWGRPGVGGKVTTGSEIVNFWQRLDSGPPGNGGAD